MSAAPNNHIVASPPGHALLARPVRMVAFGLIAFIGAAAFVQPFVMPWSPWRWMPASESDLQGADVNADLLSIDENGMVLSMQGERPISVILPPTGWRADSPPVLRVRFGLGESSQQEPPALESPEGRPHVIDFESPVVSILIRLLWQESPGAAYRYVQQPVFISKHVKVVDLPLPVGPDRIHRAGVQFVGVDEPLQSVRLVWLELPELSRSKRLALAWQSFTTPEPIENHSVNFLRGPALLGRSMNVLFFMIVFMMLGIVGMTAAVRRRPLTRFMIVAPILATWLMMDGWATVNLVRQARAERSTYTETSPKASIALTWGREIAWAADAIVRHAKPGATYAVVSDDAFGPAHRIDYLLTPGYRRIADASAADFVLVVQPSRARFDKSGGTLKFDSPDGSVQIIAGGEPSWEQIDAFEQDALLIHRRRSP